MTNETITAVLTHGGSTYDLSARVVFATWTQRPTTNGIGTFQIVFDNCDANLSGGLSADDLITVSINSVEKFKGRIDKQPMKLKGFQNYIYVSGRDGGQDLQNKILWSLYAHTASFSGKADDILEDMLTQTSSEITFNSPGTAPEMYYSADWLHLSEQFKEVLESVDYTGFVDKDLAFDMWPLTPGKDSGIVLKSLPGDAANNVVGDVEFEPGDSTDVRNYLIVQGPKKNKDAYTELNAADWTTDAGDTLSDYTATSPVTPKAGVAAIKCVPNDGAGLSFKLSFPKYWLWYLDLHLINSDDLKFSLAMHLNAPAGASDALQVELTDTNGRMMYWQEANVGYTDRWHEITIKVGTDESFNAKWQASGGFDKALFTWLITDIRILFVRNAAPGDMAYMLLDDLQIPCGTVAAVDLTASTPVHTSRPYKISRPDIVSQVELQQYADQLAPKLNAVIPSLKCTVLGTAGLISGAWKWLPGYYATAQIKDANGNYIPANNSKWRFMELTHTFDPKAPNRNQIYTVDVKAVPFDQVVDNQRWIYVNDDDPSVSAIRRVRDRLQYIERTQTTISAPQP